MIPKNRMDIIREFRGKMQAPEENVKKKPTHIPPKNQRGNNSPYSSFLERYRDLENHIDDFKTRDLVYFFREVAEDSGHKYTISNIKKDMAIFKRLTENYTPKEICCMIEFLFQSEQDYLDKDRVSPNLLASQWVNTIYADMQLWVEDQYIPKSKKIKTKAQKGEWKKTKEEGSKIGLKL